jgi:cyclopropane-fatty-acyl-phospholipid synthase
MERRRWNDGAAQAFLEALPKSAIAVEAGRANEQHYEVPAAYFTHVLGPRMKYSCCHYDTPEATLAEAEERMLALTAERAQIADGMGILELGCGWGSLSLWLAERFPNARITGVSNSSGQREFIQQRCAERGIHNVRIITADVNEFVAPQTYDRIVSVEMFEHLRNHDRMLRRLSDWLRPGGSAFVHIFCHRSYAYPYEAEGSGNWMAKYFFTGGMMPSYDLLTTYRSALRVEQRWQVDGLHYYRTCMDWLARHDAARAEIISVFAGAYGPGEAERWFNRWRLFYLACSELFRYRQGQEWFVGHYRFVRV